MIRLKDNPALIAEIEARYGMRRQFISAYLRRYDSPGSLPSGYPLRNLEDLLQLPEPFPMWIDYAMSANKRGARMVEFLRPHLAPGATRYLDIGCGFGGFMVAFAQAGMQVSGFEIDPERVMLANANCSDFQLIDAVHQGDILDDRFTATLGAFDAITMIDVIEHVLDVPKALNSAVRLLNTGGVLLLEIPNRHSINFVASDGHFGLFGITLLDRWQAIEYQRHFHTFAYDVGDYYELSAYQDQLTSLGCEVTIHASPFYTPRPLDSIPALLEALLARRDEYLNSKAANLPHRLNADIQYRFSRYVNALSSGIRTLHSNVGEFQQRYLTDFWTVIARKAR